MTKSSHKTIIIIIVILLVIGGAIALFRIDNVKAPSINEVSSQKIVIRPTKGVKAPQAVFTKINGKQAELSDFKGKKVMLWFLATWCSSCSAGARVLAQNNSKLGNLTIIAIETYGDAGYQGPPVKEFAQRTDPNLLSMPNWVWGNASQEATAIYNSRNFPDIYFLIDENGILQDVDSAPAATINKIIQFSNK